MQDPAFIKEIQHKAQSLSEQVSAEFGSLDGETLNMQPAPKKWSVGECLDHLITTSRSYHPLFTKLVSGTYKPNWWEHSSPFSGYFGRLLIESTGPVVKKPYKSPPAFQSTRSRVPADIVEAFLREYRQWQDWVGQLSELDVDKTRVTSPASGLVTYSLRDCLTIIQGHTERHINQARRALETVAAHTNEQ
ncbi:MAG: DinB family protein [Flavobacteriales bacterium]|nr:DinB family protein [Flavobacteriales bacterium]MCB9447092.1 DinB family protein [Flavobacteriales bacterium]